MRRGQSSVEPLLRFTAVMLVLLLLCYLNFDRLLVGVYEASLWFQDSSLFDRAAELIGGKNA